MTRCFSFVLAVVFVLGHLSALRAETPEQDKSVLAHNSAIDNAHDAWQRRIAEVTDLYVKKLEAALKKDKPKGDFEYLKGLENALEKAKTEHKSPSILFDRLPPKIMPFLSEMNKAKSRANKAYLAVLDKEFADALKQKDLEKAKLIDEFVVAAFLPKIIQARFSDAIRYQNKIFLPIPPHKTWADAYQWCRERKGDLASIGSIAEQAHLFKEVTKQGKMEQIWIGGVKVGGRWVWTDGTPFGFAFWAPRQPSGGSQDRIVFGFGENGSWDDGDAPLTKAFIAQWTLF